MVNYHETRFPQKDVKSEVLDALIWITPGVDRKVAIRHQGNIPHVRDFELVSPGRIAVHLRVHSGIETCPLQFGDCYLGEDSLWKDHYAVMLVCYLAATDERNAKRARS